jgi:hypothetical protein
LPIGEPAPALHILIAHFKTGQAFVTMIPTRRSYGNLGDFWISLGQFETTLSMCMATPKMKDSF